MNTFLDCYPCFFDQALRAGRMATDDEHKIKELLDRVGAMISEIPMERTPPEMGAFIYGKVREITGVADPYRTLKETNIREALSLYPGLKEMVEGSGDRMQTAIRLAIAGNVIDLGVRRKFNLTNDIREILEQKFAIFHYEAFKEHLHRASSVMYIGDNAGESVFDRLLIEELGKPVSYVVREIPVINDVTAEDALASGIGEVAEIISSGCIAPGTIPGMCSESFMKRFRDADMVISKGQGNYEGLSGTGRPVFFLLRAKCQVIAGDLGVKENDIVLKGINL